MERASERGRRDEGSGREESGGCRVAGGGTRGNRRGLKEKKTEIKENKIGKSVQIIWNRFKHFMYRILSCVHPLLLVLVLKVYVTFI